MSVPSVTLQEQDGQSGVLPEGSRALAIVGTAPSGTADSPAGYGRTQDLVTAFGSGRMVHAGGYLIRNYALPVVAVRCGNTTAATEDTIDITGVAGTSVVTYDADTTADDDYELYFRVVTGGTIGTSGITFYYSKDGGRTLSTLQSLGTATTFVFPSAGGVGFAFAAGTLVAGDIVRGRTHAPKPNGTEVASALLSLNNTLINFDLVYCAFDIDATLFDAIETAFGGTKLARKAWIGNTRLPTNGETEAAYLSSLSGVFSAKATTHGMLCAGAAKVTSGIDSLKYRRPIADAVAARAASVSAEVDLADVNLGTLPGTSIRDANGNADEHDEAINPGLDDARFCTLRTVDEIQGVYVNNPRLFSAAGSDFEFLQHRRVMNVAEVVLKGYFIRRLSRPIRVSKKTGYILEADAVEIETEANALVEAALRAQPMASGGGLAGGKYVTVSRYDAILSTKTLTVQAGIVPLAYPKAIVLPIGFRNPALLVQAV